MCSPTEILAPRTPNGGALNDSPLVLSVSGRSRKCLATRSSSSSSHVGVRLATPSNIICSCFLRPSRRAMLPFSRNSNRCLVAYCRRISKGRCTTLCARALAVGLRGRFLPFLCPGRCISFSSGDGAYGLTASLIGRSVASVSVLGAFCACIADRVSCSCSGTSSIRTNCLPSMSSALDANAKVYFSCTTLAATVLHDRSVPYGLRVNCSNSMGRT